MSGVRYYCRQCAKFVSGPLATCRACGHQHDRDGRASEEPPIIRRRNRNNGRSAIMGGRR